MSFDADFAAAEEALAEVFGVSVVYTTAAGSVTLTAEVLGLASEQQAGDVVALEIDTRQYVVAAADLVIAGSAVTPARGHTIAETIRGTSRVFEVLPGGNQTCYEELPGERRLLIHTKRIS